MWKNDIMTRGYECKCHKMFMICCIALLPNASSVAEKARSADRKTACVCVSIQRTIFKINNRYTMKMNNKNVYKVKCTRLALKSAHCHEFPLPFFSLWFLPLTAANAVVVYWLCQNIERCLQDGFYFFCS